MKISNEEISRMYFLDLKDYNYFFSEDEYKKWGKKGIDKSVKNLKKVVEITSNRNINLTILYLFEPSIILKKPNNEPINYLLRSLKNLENDNSKFFVINHFYDEYKDKYESYKKLFFINDIHLNKKGNKLVADEILRKINF